MTPDEQRMHALGMAQQYFLDPEDIGVMVGRNSAFPLSADLRGVVSEADIQALDERNLQRAREAAIRLGTNYALHPQWRGRPVVRKGA